MPFISAAVLATITVVAVQLLGSAVAAGVTQEFDRGILLWVRAHTGGDGAGWQVLRMFFQGLTTLGGTVVLTILGVGGTLLLLWQRRAKLALFFALQALAGTGMVSLLKMHFDRPRPDVVEHLAPFRAASFPSGHSANSSIIYLTLAMVLITVLVNVKWQRPIWVVAIVLPFVIGLSRVFLGVHWPTDVLAGWTFGFGWAFTMALIVDGATHGEVFRRQHR